MEKTIKDKIISEMKEVLNKKQVLKLIAVLENLDKKEYSNIELIDSFLRVKSIEGCSYKTNNYYKILLLKIDRIIQRSFMSLDTDDIRRILEEYQRKNHISLVSLDNVRRVLSSFYNYLEEEQVITVNPMKRIHKIKTIKKVKKVYSLDEVQSLKESCENIRDLAILELLASSGMRVGELCNLNIKDINLELKECVVFGKGGKERRVYFDSSTKLHLRKYLLTRIDQNEALFVSQNKPYKRLQISGVEIMLKRLGNKTLIEQVHPHKFRRTLATSAIDKGMPIEQVQKLLGHTKIESTLEYALVDQVNVSCSYRKLFE